MTVLVASEADIGSGCRRSRPPTRAVPAERLEGRSANHDAEQTKEKSAQQLLREASI
jgi:hypothetical protein